MTLEARIKSALAAIGADIKALSSSGMTADPLILSSSDGSAPAADKVKLFRRSVAGRQLPAFVGPAGLESTVQSALHGNTVFFLSLTAGGTAPAGIGGSITTAATMSTPALAATSSWTATQRKRFQTAATAGAATGLRASNTQWWRGNAAGRGGFFYRCWFGQSLHVAGSRAFVGLTASLTAMANDPSNDINFIGMGFDAADAGNWQLIMRDATNAAVKVDLGAGAARNATNAFELAMFCPPHNGAAAPITVQVRNLVTGQTVLAPTPYATNLPVETAFLAASCQCSNGAVASAVNIEIAKLYIESDM
jgi:hypothetical protein